MCVLFQIERENREDIILYGRNQSKDICELLIIAIDDDDQKLFTPHISQIIDMLELNDITCYLLHLKSFDDGKDIIQGTFDWKILNNYSFVKNALRKIYLIDIFDKNNSIDAAKDIINLASNNEYEYFVMSIQGQILPQMQNNHRTLMKQGQRTIRSGFIQPLEDDLRDILNEIRPDKLADLSSNDWHEMRTSDDSRKNKISDPHHWEGGADKIITDDNSELLWEKLSKINMSNNKNLQVFIMELGYGKYYKELMFQSTISKPAIRELLQTDNKNQDFTKYLMRIESSLRSRSKDIDISIETGEIIDNYCWFNICALYRAFDCIIKGYYQELDKMRSRKINISNPSIRINIKEIRNDDKTGLLVVTILEDPLEVVKVSWPISSSNNSIKPQTEELLRYINNQGVNEIYYHAKDYNGTEKMYNVNITKALNNSNDFREDSTSSDNFTFKWSIPAFITKNPYTCQIDVWTCKHEGA